MDERAAPRDPLVERVEKRLATGEVVAKDLVAEVLNSLADELPDHIGPGAQWAYRGWLRQRAAAARGEEPYTPTVLAEQYRWQ